MAEVERLAALHPDLGVTLETGDEGDVPVALEPLAQSVLAEAVRNAHKHAKPNRVSVRVGRSEGVEVVDVAQGSPAHRAGLRAEDLIVELRGEPIERVDDVQRLMSHEAVGRPMIGRRYGGAGSAPIAPPGSPPSSACSCAS